MFLCGVSGTYKNLRREMVPKVLLSNGVTWGSLKLNTNTADEMAQRVKAFALQVLWPEFNPWKAREDRR